VARYPSAEPKKWKDQNGDSLKDLLEKEQLVGGWRRMINEYRRFHMKFTRNYFLRFLAILFISASFSGCGKKPKQTADHFMSLLVAGKHLEVQEMLGKDMKSMAGMLGGVSNESLKPYFRAGTFKSYALTEQEKTDKSVRYRVDAITSDGNRYSDFIDLIREDGDWKISRF